MSFVTGRFTDKEDAFIRTNHQQMTDQEIAAHLNRKEKSVTNRRAKLGLSTKRNKPKLTKKHREAYVATLNDEERKKFFQSEIIGSAQFRNAAKSLSADEQDYYIEKYVNFMMDPTVETMTSMEKDALHQLLISEIRILRHMQEEKGYNDIIKTWDPSQGKPPAPISRAKEIRECQEVILKCQASLNVERKQRLKNQSDQSITFTNLIKEMKNPQTRNRLGHEATMLKVIAERFYNSHMGKNIFSGNGRKFELAHNFKDGEVPDLPEDFFPTVKPDESE